MTWKAGDVRSVSSILNFPNDLLSCDASVTGIESEPTQHTPTL